MERRRFLRYAASTPLLSIGGCRSRSPQPADAAAKKTDSESAARTLTGMEWATLEALCGRILPADEQAGAIEAGAIRFIDRQLAYPPYKRFRRLVGGGLRHLERLARRMHRRPFADLPAAKQDDIIRVILRGRSRRSGQRFLRVIVPLTLEGTFGDPLYGGNRDRLGWQMIGFTPQLPAPQVPFWGMDA